MFQTTNSLKLKIDSIFYVYFRHLLEITDKNRAQAITIEQTRTHSIVQIAVKEKGSSANRQQGDGLQ
jgi:hypothetical protein